MKEAVTKVIDALTQEDLNGAFQELLERHNKCVAAGGDNFEGDKSFMCVLSIKVPIRKISLETYLMILVCINLQWLICHKTISNQPKPNQTIQNTSFFHNHLNI